MSYSDNCRKPIRQRGEGGENDEERIWHLPNWEGGLDRMRNGLVALSAAIALCSIYLGMAQDGNADMLPIKGKVVGEGSNRCCDVAQNCIVGNGVCDCLADKIVDPNGRGYCYSCDHTNCNA